jgi:uncharacterized membrane protein|tara:strand:+ start:1185 stop:1955 length:771 start_codon:yes stop_codon:yes gene_type:complete
MGSGLTHEDMKVLKEYFANNKKTIRYLSTYFKEFIMWIVCIVLTFMLCLTIPISYISPIINTIAFDMWDEYMELIDRKRIIKERIGNTDEDYLIRYYLFIKGNNEKEIRKWPFNIFLHKFIKSDVPIFHSHPWKYATIILHGGYIEHVPVKNNKITGNKRLRSEDNDVILNNDPVTYSDFTIKRKPFTMNVTSINHKHWIELEKDKPCWTLFFPLKKEEKKWGFFPYMNKSTDNEHANKNEETFVPYDEFLNSKNS